MAGLTMAHDNALFLSTSFACLGVVPVSARFHCDDVIDSVTGLAALDRPLPSL